MVFSFCCSCKAEKKSVRYTDLYNEQPTAIYVAPVVDFSQRKALRSEEDSAYNVSVGIAAKQFYYTAIPPLIENGYYSLGPLASANISKAEKKNIKQLRNESISDYKTNYGIDAVLFINIHNWRRSNQSIIVYVEYVVRSTQSGSELIHVWVKGEKQLLFDHKGRIRPTQEDINFMSVYDCDVETSQRCLLVETMNRFVLRDIPSGKYVRKMESQKYSKSHPEFFRVLVKRDNSVEMKNIAMDEDVSEFSGSL